MVPCKASAPVQVRLRLQGCEEEEPVARAKMTAVATQLATLLISEDVLGTEGGEDQVRP